jgi:hypothetical protein
LRSAGKCGLLVATMATCLLCEKSGWLLSITGGACPACIPAVLDRFDATTKGFADAARAGNRSKMLDTRMEHWERALRVFEQLTAWEKRGISVDAILRTRHARLSVSIADWLLQQRETIDGEVVEAIELEMEDALQRARAAATPKRAEQALSKTLERIRYFKQKMTRPERLDSAQAKLASFGAVTVVTCTYCGGPVTEGHCHKCGASSAG